MGRRLPAVLLSLFLMLVAAGGISPVTAAPSTAPTGAAGTGASEGDGDDGDATGSTSADGFARIDVTGITPSVVSSGSGDTVTVTGSVINTSDRTIDDLIVRLQLGDRITEAAGLRTSLAADPATYTRNSPFVEVDSELEVGERSEFEVSVPLSGPDGLGIDQTGVYPLLVNVNGTPEYGGPARIADSRTLLPVLSLPPDEDRAAGYTDPASGDGDPLLGRDGSVSADLSRPADFTMLWPLAARPQLAPGILGANTEPVRLVSEDLARSLSRGGRLFNLVAALEPLARQPVNEAGDPIEAEPGVEALRSGLCLAVDPDLLVTVVAMSQGYVITDDPEDPTAATRPGAGSGDAAAWLASLRQAAARSCVIALPFAQAGLESLARVDDIGLSRTALADPADVVDTILGVRSVRGATIPAIGTLSDAGAELLTQLELPSALLADTGVEPGPGRTASDQTPAVRTPADPAADDAAASGAYRLGDLRVQTYQQPVSDALGALGDDPRGSAITPDDQRVRLSTESVESRRQAAIAALFFQALDRAPPGADSPAPLPVTGYSQLIMPPTYWGPDADDAAALFANARLLLDSGVSRARPLTSLLEQLGAADDPARLIEPPGIPADLAAGLPVSASAAADIRAAAETSWRFQSSLVSSDDAAGTPQRYVGPLREDLLRALRTPEQAGSTIRETIAEQRRHRIDAVDITLDRMQEAVSLLDPGGRYTLASERSPLLLVVRNDLALPVRVRLQTDAPNGLEIGDTGVLEIPARGTRQLQLPTMADSSEALTVDIRLVTSTGMPVGQAVTLSVHSNAYGRALFVITIVAAVALVLLTARRLWRRFRGEPDPADLDRPEPDEHERLLAASTYRDRLAVQRELEATERPLIGPEIPVDLDFDDASSDDQGPRDQGPRDQGSGDQETGGLEPDDRKSNETGSGKNHREGQTGPTGDAAAPDAPTGDPPPGGDSPTDPANPDSPSPDPKAADSE